MPPLTKVCRAVAPLCKFLWSAIKLVTKISGYLALNLVVKPLYYLTSKVFYPLTKCLIKATFKSCARTADGQRQLAANQADPAFVAQRRHVPLDEDQYTRAELRKRKALTPAIGSSSVATLGMPA
jgi:hypothetical protein